MGDVPLAAVVRLVAPGPEPVTQRRDRVRIEPAHSGIGVLLRDPVRLRGTVQRGYCPVNRVARLGRQAVAPA